MIFVMVVLFLILSRDVMRVEGQPSLDVWAHLLILFPLSLVVLCTISVSIFFHK